jgi:hypothetical protein
MRIFLYAADRAAHPAANSADRAADSAADRADHADRAAHPADRAAHPAADSAADRAAESAADSAADRAANHAANSAHPAADRAADSAAHLFSSVGFLVQLTAASIASRGHLSSGYCFSKCFNERLAEKQASKTFCLWESKRVKPHNAQSNLASLINAFIVASTDFPECNRNHRFPASHAPCCSNHSNVIGFIFLSSDKMLAS